MHTDQNIFDCLLDPSEIFDFYLKLGKVLKNDRDISAERVHGKAMQNTLVLLQNTAMIQRRGDEYVKLFYCETYNSFYTALISGIKNTYVDEVAVIVNCNKHYDEIKNAFYIYVNDIPLRYMGLAMLMEQTLEFKRINNREYFVGIDNYQNFIKKKQLVSIEMLQKRLQQNNEHGEQAEKFAWEYELARLKGFGLDKEPLRISSIDVMAGYDMISYENKNSDKHDRFIEVKAISNTGFFWSRNEYETAKIKGERYYLYLVDLKRVNEADYSPEIIQNPAISVMKEDGWFIEAESYHIKRI